MKEVRNTDALRRARAGVEDGDCAHGLGFGQKQHNDRVAHDDGDCPGDETEDGAEDAEEPKAEDENEVEGGEGTDIDGFFARDAEFSPVS